MKLIDLTGRRFGKWTVIGRHHGNYRRSFAQWECVCECGTSRVVLANSLLQGKSSGCGCARRARLAARNYKHGQSDSRTYCVWRHMHQRCSNPRSKDYQYYGARGISVCEAWSDFSAFLADMGDAPDGLTIDRIDNDGNYEPGNCRWASMAEQNANKRGQFVAKRTTT